MSNWTSDRKYRRRKALPSDRLLLEGILWKLAGGLRWQDLKSEYPVRACQDLYRQLCRTGRMQSILQQLLWHLNVYGKATLAELVERGCFEISGHQVLLSPSEELTWEKYIALVLLQQAFHARRSIQREADRERRRRGNFFRFPALRLLNSFPRHTLERQKGIFSTQVPASQRTSRLAAFMQYNLPDMPDLFSRWKIGLSRSSKAAFGRLASLFGATEISSDTWEELEGLLIQADLGLETTESVLDSLRTAVRTRGITRAAELRSLLEAELRLRLDISTGLDFSSKPTVILLVGVNGSGKTTTAAKLGSRFARDGKRVLLVAADTFRAAAVDQLQIWAERLNLPFVAGQMGSDPGAVVYDGIQSAVSKGYDLVLVDTAGRLHTRYNLMEELKKVYRVSGKAFAGAPHAVWLVLDATTGQNALVQARAFKQAVNVTGVILAKLDSSAHGGMAFAIQRELGLPIIYAGLGETADDLTPFDPDAFVKGILDT